MSSLVAGVLIISIIAIILFLPLDFTIVVTVQTMVVRFAAMCVVFYTFLCPQLTDSPRPHLVRPGI